MKPLKQPKLYKKLIDAFSNENLNFITSELIELYQEKLLSIFSGIANKISDFIVIDEDKDALCLSRPIVLHHTDNYLTVRIILKMSLKDSDIDTLSTFSTTLLSGNINFDSTSNDHSYEYEPEYTGDNHQIDSYILKH